MDVNMSMNMNANSDMNMSLNTNTLPTTTKGSHRWALITSYVFGGIAVVTLIVAVLMLFFVRDVDSHTIPITPTPTPFVTPPSIFVPPDPLSLSSKFPAPDLSRDYFNSALLENDAVFGPLSKRYLPLPKDEKTGEPISGISALDEKLSDNQQNKNYNYPGAVEFSATTFDPLRFPPQGFSFGVLSPAGVEFVTSMPNGIAEFTGFKWDNSQFRPQVTDGKPPTNPNRVYFTCDPQQNPAAVVNISAASVGSTGFSSIAMSPNGARLYMGYQTALTGSTLDSSAFPFRQMCGRVSTFTHPVDQGVVQDFNSWTFDCGLSLSNPVGSLANDRFGATIRTTLDRTSQKTMVAVSCDRTLLDDSVSSVYVFQESGNGTQTQTGFVVAPKLVDFDIDSTEMVASASQKVYFFGFSFLSRQYEQFQVIVAPHDAVRENFGTSVRLTNDAQMLIVGSPSMGTASGPGIGGSVYIYRLNAKTRDVFDLDYQRISAVSPDDKINQGLSSPWGAFGHFLSLDVKSQLLSISFNQNNATVYVTAKTQREKATERAGVYLVPIDQKKRSITINTNTYQTLYQPDGVSEDQRVKDNDDPLIGCNLSIAISSSSGDIQTKGNVSVLLCSPLNQRMWMFRKIG